VTKNSTRKFDPSFVVEADIRDANGALIHAKGKVINPLDYADFNEIWVFIDGDDEEQRDLASKIRKKQQNTKIILTGGAPGLQENGSWYFFDQFGEICKKMGITKVPAIVRQAKNQKLIEIVDVVPHDMLPHDVLSHEVLLP
jgi:conjugal transfer pilus assembly protein TraW